jgi:predicted small metal-binding protein
LQRTANAEAEQSLGLWESTTQPTAKGASVAKLINCECGRGIRAETEEEVIRLAEEHIRDSHPELVGVVTRDQLLDWIEEE